MVFPPVSWMILIPARLLENSGQERGAICQTLNVRAYDFAGRASGRLEQKGIYEL